MQQAFSRNDKEQMNSIIILKFIFIFYLSL